MYVKRTRPEAREERDFTVLESKDGANLCYETQKQELVAISPGLFTEQHGHCLLQGLRPGRGASFMDHLNFVKVGTDRDE